MWSNKHYYCGNSYKKFATINGYKCVCVYNGDTRMFYFRVACRGGVYDSSRDYKYFFKEKDCMIACERWTIINAECH